MGISEVLTVVVDVGRPDDGNHTLQLVLDCGDDVVELGFAEESQVVNNQEANNWKRPLRVTFDGFGVDMSAGDGLQIGTEFVPWGGAACIMEPDYSFGSTVAVCGESGCTLIPADNATRQVRESSPVVRNSRTCSPIECSHRAFRRESATRGDGGFPGWCRWWYNTRRPTRDRKWPERGTREAPGTPTRC